MLQFSKSIIEGVSFDSYLFGKELRKLVLWYGNDKEHMSAFYQWCIQNFGNVHMDTISDAFDKFDFSNNKEEIALNRVS